MQNGIFEGKSFASFGEIIQGRKSCGEDFLITLPIDLWSVCTLNITYHNGPLLINCTLAKSQKVVELVFGMFNIRENYRIDLSIARNIPVGKGFSSSTADMNSTLKALELFLQVEFTFEEISIIFNKVEPHDALMYDTCVSYNHRKGLLLNNLNYIPKFRLIVVDFGGEVDTINYNKNLSIANNFLIEYDELYDECIAAFQERNDYKIAKCSTKSLKISLERNEDINRKSIYDSYLHFNSIGLINTHSGTSVGFIYPNSISEEELEFQKAAIEDSFIFSTSIINLINE